jgi:hypothetical protein
MPQELGATMMMEGIESGDFDDAEEVSFQLHQASSMFH